jgi:cytoskeletal protein RodZ
MQTVGTYLKSNREAKNISLSEISHHTKISKWYLDCLEKDDFTNIPGGPYIKGYISSYATYLGIDENEAIKKYDSSNPESESRDQTDTSIGKKARFRYFAHIPKKISMLGLALIILTLLLTVVYHFIFQTSEDKKLQKTYKDPEQNDFQSSKSQMKARPSEGSKLEKTNSDIRNAAPTKNLESETFTLPEPVINHPAAETISKSPAQLETSNTETPPLNTDSARQKKQIQPNESGEIKVIDAVAAAGLQNKNPVAVGKSFQWSNGRVYIWSMINCTNPPSSIKHIYYFKGQKVSEVLLEVKSHQWRTWSFKTISDKGYIGQWRVDITSADGKVLKTIRFEVN